MYFEEDTQEWVQVTKPDNLDYNVAEKTTLTFPSPHGYIVGDFLTEDVSGAVGVVYNLIDVNVIEVARYNEIQFPETGTVDNGSSSPQPYSSAVIEHGIDNLVLQELTNRTGWLKNETQRLTNRDTVIENRIEDVRTWLTVSSNTLVALDKKYLVDTSGNNVVLTLPPSSPIGRHITFCHYNGDLNVRYFEIAGGGNMIMSQTANVRIDLTGVPFRAVFLGGVIGWQIIGD